MKFVEKFFEEKSNKKLEDYLKRRYPTLEFKFNNENSNAELLVFNKSGVVLAIFDLEDFDLTLNTRKCPIDAIRYLEFVQVSSEATLKRIYMNYLRGVYPDYRDKLIDHLSFKTNECTYNSHY